MLSQKATRTVLVTFALTVIFDLAVTEVYFRTRPVVMAFVEAPKPTRAYGPKCMPSGFDAATDQDWGVSYGERRLWHFENCVQMNRDQSRS
jgi:hypothetical protein